MRWKKGQATQDEYRDGVKSVLCSSTARNADGREVRDCVPWCQILVQSQLWSSSQDHNPAKQILHWLSMKWIFMCIMRKEAEVFTQAPVFYLNCSQAKSQAVELGWDLVRSCVGRCPGCGEQKLGAAAQVGQVGEQWGKPLCPPKHSPERAWLCLWCLPSHQAQPCSKAAFCSPLLCSWLVLRLEEL